ncbi:HD family phosphohydrolase [Rhodohalobacter sulfatireducens]|uniref:HDIG domain-containing protein n=1 Tax=Rhodohalobacter sulfatireducens TaxID=2911366 RepID=A0ABS9KBY8_9BACT|nr:HDIG domain-containing metalloprotein [Rhodohalobacter sulfatireducens]MCG2588348.1 HDIG domain-containing protein [Rhodohalobacter sulfatireducens]
MSILKKLGLGQKKREAAPNIGANKIKEQKETAEKKNRYLRALIVICFLLVILITLPGSTFQSVSNYSVGEPWRSDDLTAPFTFAIQKTAEEIQQERQQIRRQTAPIFHVAPEARADAEAAIDSLYRNLQPVLDSFIQWQQSKQQQDGSAANDSLRHLQERAFSNVELDSSSWNTILENYSAVTLNNQPQERTVVAQIRNQVQNLTNSLMSDGIINRSKENLESDEITIRDLEDRTERIVSIESVKDPSEIDEFAQRHLNRIFIPEVAQAAIQIFNQVIKPNLIYSEAATNELLSEKLSDISPTKGAVDQGQIIIRTGDIITPETANVLRSLAEARAQTASTLERWLRFLGESIVIVMATLMFLFYIFLYRRSIFNQPSMLLLVFLVMGVVSLASILIYPIDVVNSYIIPLSIAPIILTIIFDSRVGLMATITLAIITGLVHDNNFEYLVATTAACTLGVFSVRDIKKRSQFFFITPGIVFITYFIIISGFSLTRLSGWENFWPDLLYIAINSVFILFTYPLILLFEKLFKITTDFTLLELADTNLPLMKELMGKAPGTFHHSLQVANLADSAASQIGANALQCRVGAMYHDIGKMVKPSYFIENQNKTNEHEKLKPRMSTLVIKAHVSEGVKIAEEHNLPKVIIEFIKTHHGTSLIKYFHKKASDEEQGVQDEDFRYDGPIPYTKEQGILMLADSVEAACRSMKEPSYNKLENRIHQVVDNHIHDGQLSNCPLTFRQIQIIKDSFLSILKGVYHSRIEYPEDEKQKKGKAPSNEPKQQPEPSNTSEE